MAGGMREPLLGVEEDGGAYLDLTSFTSEQLHSLAETIATQTNPQLVGWAQQINRFKLSDDRILDLTTLSIEQRQQAAQLLVQAAEADPVHPALEADEPDDEVPHGLPWHKDTVGPFMACVCSSMSIGTGMAACATGGAPVFAGTSVGSLACTILILYFFVDSNEQRMRQLAADRGLDAPAEALVAAALIGYPHEEGVDIEAMPRPGD